MINKYANRFYLYRLYMYMLIDNADYPFPLYEYIVV